MRRSLIALALVVAGCTPEICARNSDCASGQVCGVTGLCAIPADAAIDAGSNDAGTTTAGDASPGAPDDAELFRSLDAPYSTPSRVGDEGP